MAIKQKMPGFEFTPEHCRTMLIDSLEWSWDDCNTFEVPRSTEPYVYLLKVTVDPLNEQVTIERSLS